MDVLFKSDWSTITAKADKVVEIDIEGIIGFDWWDDDDSIIKSKEKMKAELKAISTIKATDIIVNINSPGGDVGHGFSIHDLLASHEAKITTVVNGLTASAATVIAQAGDVRKMSDNALYLVHNSMTMAFGNKNQIRSVIGSLEKVDGRMESLYAKRSGKEASSFTELMDANNGVGEWITAEEAQDHGLIDEVFEPMAMAANINFNHKKYGYPSFESKFQNLNNQKMENNEKVETTDEKVMSFVDKVLAKINPKKEVEKVEPSDEDIQAIADATTAQVEAAEAEKQIEIDALAVKAAADKVEIDELKAKNARLEAKETGSTKSDETLDKKNKTEPEFSSMVDDQLNKINARYGTN